MKVLKTFPVAVGYVLHRCEDISVTKLLSLASDMPTLFFKEEKVFMADYAGLIKMS